MLSQKVKSLVLTPIFIGYKYIGAFTKERDYVGEGLGGNKGNNK